MRAVLEEALGSDQQTAGEIVAHQCPGTYGRPQSGDGGLQTEIEVLEAEFRRLR